MQEYIHNGSVHSRHCSLRERIRALRKLLHETINSLNARKVVLLDLLGEQARNNLVDFALDNPTHITRTYNLMAGPVAIHV